VFKEHDKNRYTLYWIFEKDLPDKMSNEELDKKTGCKSTVLEINLRRWTWLEHVLKTRKDSIYKATLRRPPSRKGNQDDNKGGVRRDGLSWGKAQAAVKDRTVWTSIVVAC